VISPAFAGANIGLRRDILIITIKSGRGTWPDDTAATCQGKVRTPRDGGNMSNSDVLPTCGCRTYFPGHNCHVVQATRANSDPTSWFAARVTALEQEEATVKYDDGSTCRLWRHGGFDERVAVGAALLTCEPWSLISVLGSDGRDQLSVEVRNPSWRKAGLPEDRPRRWSPGIVNNATGEGVDILHGND
jgi:hypothetical protein